MVGITGQEQDPEFDLQRGEPGPDSYEEFLTLFARDRERIYSYIFSLLPHHADAEDVFQRCSILLWRKFASFDRERSFLSWACGMAFYEVHNFLRVSGRDRLRFDLDLIGRLAERRMASLENDEPRITGLRQCLEKLNEAERRLLELVYGEDRTIRDLAVETGRADQTLYNRLSRIRRRLFDCVQRSLERQR